MEAHNGEQVRAQEIPAQDGARAIPAPPAVPQAPGGPRPQGLGHGEARAEPIRVESDFYRDAHRAVLRAGWAAEVAPHRAATVEHGERAAEAMYPRPFDPQEDASDAERQAEQEQRLRSRPVLQVLVEQAAGALHEAEEALAGEGDRPTAPRTAATAALATLAGTVLLGAAALPATRVLGAGGGLSPLLAAGAGLLVTGCFTAGALGAARQASDVRAGVPAGWWPVAGAISLAAFLAAALPGSLAGMPPALAGGLALLELGLLTAFLLQFSGFARAHAEHRERRQRWSERAEAVSAARRLLTRREAALAELESAIEAYGRWLDRLQDAWRGGQQARAQVAATVALAREDGIAANCGFLEGNAARPLHPHELRERMSGREDA